ncbi:hypothetical protein FQZ97_443660 [compost metagenome]
MVKIARDALLARGIRPSIDAVRIELGNTGSKSTILRCLHELAGQDALRLTPTVEEELLSLITPVADRLREEAQAAVAAERELLTRQQLDYRTQRQQSEARIQELQHSNTEMATQLQEQRRLELALQEQLRASEMERSRLQAAEQGLRLLSEERAQQLQSLEEKHQHARQALEHYRHTQKEQREQELRRLDELVQQLRREIRDLQESLIGKQDQLAGLNRDNERLLSEARTHLKLQHEWERELSTQRQRFQDGLTAFKIEETTLRNALAAMQAENARLQERLRQCQVECRHYRRVMRNQEQLLQLKPSPPLPPA